jgi:ribosomal protein S6--L-glutamate ligase
MTIIIGVGLNDWAPNVAGALLKASKALGIQTRIIDVQTLSIDVADRQLSLKDKHGDVRVTHLSPTLLYMRPSALLAYRAAEEAGAIALNPVESVIAADDKGLTALYLARAGLAQVPTLIVPLTLKDMLEAFQSLNPACIFKRTHGGQGRWVRLARSEEDVRAIYEYFKQEGPSAIVVQRVVEESLGTAVRVIVTGGCVLGATTRTSHVDFRSNIALGSAQVETPLSKDETDLVTNATKALGLGHAGVDMLRTNFGSVVLEINACPDFTSMVDVIHVDIARMIIEETVAAKAQV